MIINHVSVGASNVEKSAAFYDKVLATLGISRSHTIEGEAISYGTNFEFWVGCICGKHSISGTGTHIAFNAPTEESVKAFHAVAIENGGLCAGEPGPRPEYGDAYYAAYVHDLDGNKIEAVCT
ncbi:VOC family protein [Vibrio penaeicida]|uniref:Lactoylglutathione lyase n=1 Tax=Vibrio penaeicida TaxID=104609 RepID=A0AAV5NQ99_9VIBR|nr:VOC family protein [Vibrio penaeicida]RTZ23939.1 VOC family protein [Vibrio penaeicida]RTZ24788.1 VOC family protein [Vibrio penaeicida]GLQ72851.1 lactoylglutathione lyase [Vibrio penaeicida]